MADLAPPSTHTQRAPNPSQKPTSPSPSAAFLRKLHHHSPNSTQLLGLFTLLSLAAVSLFLVGLTAAGTTLALLLFAPFVVFSSPIWLPAAAALFLVVAGFLFFCGFSAVVVTALSWMYRYSRGLHPPGSDRVDYARSRIYDTASHVKECAWEYGGYLQGKVKDAAPGA